MSKPIKCTASRLDGFPCQAWARRDSNPPLCRIHASSENRSLENAATPAGQTSPEATREGFYDGRYTLQEIADLVTSNAGEELTDEVAAARVAVRRVLTHLEDELTPTEYAQLAHVIFTGANTIMRLIRAQHDMADPATERFAKAIGKALEEMSKKTVYDL